MRPRFFLAIISSGLARSLSNFRTLHFSPSADFCQYGLLTKNQQLGYLSLPRNVNLIYYPDGGCTRRPTGLDGSAGQPRWVQPSLTPPTGRDPLGSRQSSAGSGTRTVGPRKLGFWCEFGEFMPGPELLLIAQWLKLVPSCGYIGIQSSNRIIKKCEPVRSWHWATLCRNARFPLDEAGRLVTSRTEIENFWSVPERSFYVIHFILFTLCGNARFPLDEAGRLVTSRTEIENFRSVPERSWLLAGTVCGTKRRMVIAQVDSSWVNASCYSAMVRLKSWIT